LTIRACRERAAEAEFAPWEPVGTSLAVAKPQPSEKTKADSSAVRMKVVIVNLHGGLVCRHA
jgi:hypothetical protein